MLEIDVDFKTRQAVQNVAEFIRQWDQLKRVAGESADSIKKAGDETSKHTEKVKIGAQTMQEYRRSQEELNRAMGIGTEQMRQQTQAGESMSKSFGMWAQGIGAVALAYQGLRQVSVVLQEIEERQRRVLDDRARISQGALGLGNLMTMVMDNLGVSGRAGERKAMQVVSQYAESTATTPEQAAMAVASLASNRVDPNSQQGQLFGKFSGRYALNPDTQEKLIRLMRMSGSMQSPEAAQKFLAGLQGGAAITGETNMDRLVSGMFDPVEISMRNGLGIEQGMGQYFAALESTRNPLRAAERVRIFSRAVTGPGDDARALLADAAVSGGFMPDYKVPGADIEAAITGRGTGSARTAAGARQTIQELRENAALDDERHRVQMEADKLAITRMRERGQSAEQIAQAESEAALREKMHAQKVVERNRDLTRVQQDLDRSTAAVAKELRGTELGRRFAGLPIAVKMRSFSRMVSTAKTPAQQAAMVEAFGGQPEVFREAAAQAAPGAQEQAARASEAILAGDPAALEADLGADVLRGPARQRITESRTRFAQAQESTAGDEMANLIQQEGTAHGEAVRNELGGEFARSSAVPPELRRHGRTPTGSTKEYFEIENLIMAALDRVQELWESLTPEEQGAYRRVHDLYIELSTADPSGGKMPASVRYGGKSWFGVEGMANYKAWVLDRIREFGNLKDEIDSARQKAGGRPTPFGRRPQRNRPPGRITTGAGAAGALQNSPATGTDPTSSIFGANASPAFGGGRGITINVGNLYPAEAEAFIEGRLDGLS